ncbi:hypothetical protein ON010_g7246 [Phytophthora cinnamomi]|nr:hypothetical protein ON010_g7246 [Phytophthora cinnamomi]
MARTTPSTRSSLSSARSGPTSSSLRPEEASEERHIARRGFLQLQELESLRASKRARHHFGPLLPDSDEDEDVDHAILDNFQALGYRVPSSTVTFTARKSRSAHLIRIRSSNSESFVLC